MILIDTNVLYYASNVVWNDNYSKVADAYIKDNIGKVTMLSVSCYEFFCKYHHDAAKIDIIKKYIDNNKIQIIDDEYYVLKPSFKGQNYELIFDDCLKTRVPVEVSFCNNIINCLMSCVIFSLAMEYEIADDKEIVPVMINSIRICDAVNRRFLPEIVNGCYTNNEGKDGMWQKLKKLIESLISSILPAMNNVFSVITGKEVLYSREKYSYQKMEKKGISNYLKALIDKVDRYFDRDEFISLITEVIDKNIDGRDTISKHRLSYIVKKTLSNGNKIDKNDIIDGRFIEHIKTKDDILLSFDKGIINYLQLNDDDIYKRSVQKIKKLGAL